MDTQLSKIISDLSPSAPGERQRCNRASAHSGLVLSEEQYTSLAQRRQQALRRTRRVEFGDSALVKLAAAFCDSDFVSGRNYTPLLAEMVDIFYYYKNECGERLSDDELIAYMRRAFDTDAGGSAQYLADTCLERLCRSFNFGGDVDDDSDGAQAEQERE